MTGGTVTPLQVALFCFSDALEWARSDQRTHEVFLDIVARRIAAEYARQVDEGWRRAA